jgi:hypothetical protein
MENFREISGLPILNLIEEYNRLLDMNIINFSPREPNQICLNTTDDQPDNIHHGVGSLDLDWDKAGIDIKSGIPTNPVVRENPLKEEDFKHLCTRFHGTLFETAYNALDSMFVLGRVRIMKSRPKTCLSWHVDHNVRVHYPMQTQEGCLMVIEDQVCHLEKNKWWYTETQKKHTAFNASTKERIHLVATIISSK